jgi:hypothetical protein
MVIGSTLMIMGILIAGIWVLIEIKRLKHKLFAILLIGLILFSYFSFATIFKESDIDFRTTEGLMEGGKIYFLWLSSIGGNFMSITGSVVNMDWGVNESKEFDF